MKRQAFPLWVFVLVAVMIAVTGFAFAQVRPGSGMLFVTMAATLWTAYVAHRARRPLA